jgi:F0F1-type ATP synthase assembly protein I
LADAAPLIGIGSGLAGSLLVCLGLGHLADKKFGTDPVGFLVGAVFGMFAVFYHLYKAYFVMVGRKK